MGPETERSRKDRAIVLLAALAMDGGSVALRATPWAWLVRESSGVVIGSGGRRPPTGEQMHSLHARQTQFPTQPGRFNFGERSVFYHYLSSALFLLPIHSPPSALTAIPEGRRHHLNAASSWPAAANRTSRISWVRERIARTCPTLGSATSRHFPVHQP